MKVQRLEFNQPFNYSTVYRTFMQRSLLVLLFVVWSTAALFSQQHTIDSIESEIANAGEDSNRVKLYLLAGKTVIYQDVNKAIFYFMAAAKLSEKINYVSGAGLGYLSLGNAYSFISKTDSSLLFMSQSLVYLRKLNSAVYLGNFFGNRADTYVQISDFKKFDFY